MKTMVGINDAYFWPHFACKYIDGIEHQFYVHDEDVVMISGSYQGDTRIITGYFAYEALVCCLLDHRHGYAISTFETVESREGAEELDKTSDYAESDYPLFYPLFTK